MIKRLPYILLLMLAFSSCVPDTICRTEMDVRMKVVMKGDSMTQRGQTINFNAFDLISVVPVDYDSIVYDSCRNVSTLLLPLRDDTTCTQYLMNYHSKVDTLTVWHTNVMNYIDMACGCVFYHTIEAVHYSRNWIDSVAITQDQVVRQPVENLKIYIHGNK